MPARRHCRRGTDARVLKDSSNVQTNKNNARSPGDCYSLDVTAGKLENCS